MQIASAGAREANLHAAIGLGGNAGELLALISGTDSDVAEAQANLAEHVEVAPVLNAADLRTGIHEMANVVREVLDAGETAQLPALYASLGLATEFDAEAKTLDLEMLSTPLDTAGAVCVKRTYRWWDSNPHVLSNKAF